MDAELTCKGGGSACLPSGVTRFNELLAYVVGTGYSAAGKDGWYFDFSSTARERNLGQGVLLGGLSFTTYMPYNDLCLSEGLSDLYGVYYQTGTSWYKPVFGNNGVDWNSNVLSILPLGHGLSKQPNLHVGNKEGTTVFLQSSTGAILEIEQPNLPLRNTKTGKVSWRRDVK